jgi:hypothetical protein
MNGISEALCVENHYTILQLKSNVNVQNQDVTRIAPAIDITPEVRSREIYQACSGPANMDAVLLFATYLELHGSTTRLSPSFILESTQRCLRIK